MADIVLSVAERDRTGTGGARATRRDGLVPGVVYGGDIAAAPVSLNLNELRKVLNKTGILAKVIDIDHDGKKQPVLVRDIQFHPVTSTPLHIDLYRVTADQVITVEVAVQFVNDEESPGLKRGGVLNVVRHTIELDCPAGAIPDHITVDLTGLDIGDSVHISAIALPENVTPKIQDRDFTVATIVGQGPTVEEEDAAAAEADGVEDEGEAVEGDAPATDAEGEADKSGDAE